MAISIGLALLALAVALAALWTTNEITARVIRHTSEMINDHAVAIQRQSNKLNSDILQIKKLVNTFDTRIDQHRHDIESKAKSQAEKMNLLVQKIANLEKNLEQRDKEDRENKKNKRRA